MYYPLTYCSSYYTVIDVLSVLPDFKIESDPVKGDVDLEGMQWKPLSERKTDKIGSMATVVMSPDERGWHSTVTLNNLVLVFGGFQYM
jgi:hypothetical protein